MFPPFDNTYEQKDAEVAEKIRYSEWPDCTMTPRKGLM